MEKEAEDLKEVPDSLHQLIRYIVRGFYGRENGLVIDVLVRNACVKEEDIQELMKLDKKQLRAMLVNLKSDKLLKSRICVETQPDGKMTRHNYYYINYRSICNIIKYKLHHIHKKIETQERDSSNRASFKCPRCQNTYTDLEVKFLIDPFLGTLNCSFCKAEVEEDVSAEAAQDSRTLQAKFNEQMEPIYKLLRETENITLATEVLEPEPTIIPHLHPNAKRAPTKPKNPGEKQTGHWTDVKQPGVDYHQDVTINIGDEANQEKVTKAKEVPIWMQQSTVKEADDTFAATSSISSGMMNNRLPSPPQNENKIENSEVMKMLMLQERGSKSSLPQTSQTAIHGNYNENRSDSNDSDQDENMDNSDDDDFEDVHDNDPVIMVAGNAYNYSEVASKGQELVQLMTPEEKENYIQIGIQMYEALHE